MVYSETIRANKTWVCPKAGIYKIICVGGGGSGAASLKTTSDAATSGTAGGTTAFGTYLSASGGVTGADAYKKGYISNGGSAINGYNGASVYGTPNTASVTGCGYGASGAVYSKPGNVFVSGGQPGEVCSGLFDIEASQQVACTVGKGGTGATASESTTGLVCCYPGADGAIMIQYLGESM
jgi:hypothetical protein